MLRGWILLSVCFPHLRFFISVWTRLSQKLIVLECAKFQGTGWVGLANKPAARSDSVVQLLESMGAVLYVKTNVPQSLMVNILSNKTVEGTTTLSHEGRCLTRITTSSASPSTPSTENSSLAVAPGVKVLWSVLAEALWELERI